MNQRDDSVIDVFFIILETWKETSHRLPCEKVILSRRFHRRTFSTRIVSWSHLVTTCTTCWCLTSKIWIFWTGNFQCVNRLEFTKFLLYFVSDKGKGRISRTCAYQWVRNVCFSEKLACFVFLLPPFKALLFCLLSGGIPANIFQFKVNNTNTRERWNMFKINHQNTSFWCLLL